MTTFHSTLLALLLVCTLAFTHGLRIRRSTNSSTPFSYKDSSCKQIKRVIVKDTCLLLVFKSNQTQDEVLVDNASHSEYKEDVKEFLGGFLGNNNETESENGTVTHNPEIELNIDQLNIDCLIAHNEYRKIHNVPDLQYSYELGDYAQEWAEHLASTNTLQNRPDNKYGENIAMSSNGKDLHPLEVVKLWYDEIKDYNFNTESKKISSLGDISHMTQVLWKSTLYVGMGKAVAPNGSVYIVANYYPPGNVVGKYKENVPPRKN